MRACVLPSGNWAYLVLEEGDGGDDGPKEPEVVLDGVCVYWGWRIIFSKGKVPSSHAQAFKFKGKPFSATK